MFTIDELEALRHTDEAGDYWWSDELAGLFTDINTEWPQTRVFTDGVVDYDTPAGVRRRFGAIAVSCLLLREVRREQAVDAKFDVKHYLEPLQNSHLMRVANARLYRDGTHANIALDSLRYDSENPDPELNWESTSTYARQFHLHGAFAQPILQRCGELPVDGELAHTPRGDWLLFKSPQRKVHGWELSFQPKSARTMIFRGVFATESEAKTHAALQSAAAQNLED